MIEAYKGDAQRATDWFNRRDENLISAAHRDIIHRAYLHGEQHAIKAEAAEWTLGRVYVQYAELKSGTGSAAKWSPSTRKGNDGRIDNHFGDWKDRPVSAINAEDLNDRWAQIRATHTEASAVGIMCLVRAVIKYAFQIGRTAYNPDSKLVADELHFSMSLDTTSVRNAISMETFRALLQHCPPEHRAAVLTLATIGARIGEMCALRVEDVDLSSNPPTITICGTMNDLVRNAWTKSEKGRKRIAQHRELPITWELAALLAPLVTGRPEWAPLFAFTDSRSSRLRQDGYWHTSTWRVKVWEPMVERARAAGVDLPKEFVPHSLRHSMATWLSAHLTPAELMYRMRHSRVEMTMRYYHDNDVARRREFDAIELVMGGSRPKLSLVV